MSHNRWLPGSLSNCYLYSMLSPQIILRLCFLLCLSGKPALFAQSVPDYLNELKSRKDFDMLKGRPLSENYNGIECIKLVYSLSSGKLYYLQSLKYKWHYRFVFDVLHGDGDLGAFNDLNYGRNPKREYILATFNYNTSTKNYFLQFAPPDDISDGMITLLVNKVSQTFYKQGQFKILLNTTTLLRRKKELAKQHDVITGDELYKSQKYQPIYSGKTFGVLQFIDADSIKASVDYSDKVLVIAGNSNEIPVCRGIVTSEFQTPLSHICLLTANRKTPCAFQKNCYNNDSLKKLANTYVELSVSESGLRIRPAKPGTTVQTAHKKISLLYDTTVKAVADLKTLDIKNRKSYGSKTCNLAELKKIERRSKGISTPREAFAIPFYYYDAHIRYAHIDTLINKTLQEWALHHNDSILDQHLKTIRKAIVNAPMDTALLNRVTAMCQQRFGKSKVRFRSSSNCEDGSNFNGAGLYTSVSGISGDTSKTFERAIKKVWASLWSTRAFRERDYFNIDHHEVLMGILVHPAFDNEIANGVAITKNLYRNYEAGFVINIQKGEEEVVSPGRNIVSEQIVSYMNMGSDFYDASRSADWLSYSSLNPNGSLLSAEELYQLTLQLDRVKRHFYELYRMWPKVEYKDFGMDVEFKLIETPDHKRQFVIKQARPYNN